MTVTEIRDNKKDYLDLLLLADEQEDMIDSYLDDSRLFVLRRNGQVLALCAVLELGEGVLEVKNLAVEPRHQRRGHGRRMLEFVEKAFGKSHRLILVGTGEGPLTLPFYERCGYTFHHRVPGFFLDHYDHEIIENGVRLVDMVYLSKEIGSGAEVRGYGPTITPSSWLRGNSIGSSFFVFTYTLQNVLFWRLV